MTTTALLAPPTNGEAQAEHQYLFVLTPLNRVVAGTEEWHLRPYSPIQGVHYMR